MHKKGFTLIELLVVVLIIGILAAIAVPQYQTMILKSKAVPYLSLLKSLADSQQRYFMTNGVFAQAFEQLDIQPISGCSGGECRIKNNDHIFFNSGGLMVIYINGKNSTGALALGISYDENSAWMGGFKNRDILCIDRGKEQFVRVCKSLGGKNPIAYDNGHLWLIQF